MGKENLQQMIDNGQVSEARRTAFKQLKENGNTGADIVKPALYYCRAARMSGNYLRAEIVGLHALQTFDADGTETNSSTGKLMVEMGNVYRMQRRYDESEAQMGIARSHAIITADKKTAAQALWGRGIIQRVKGNNNEAIEIFQGALDESIQNNDALGVAHCLRELGITSANLGRHHDALVYLTDALHIYNKEGFALGIAHAKREIGISANKVGDPKTAERRLIEALRAFQNINGFIGEANTFKHMGHFYVEHGKGGLADVCFKKAAAIYTRLGDSLSLQQMEKERSKNHANQ